MDDTDIKILDCLTKQNGLTTSDIAKDLFSPPNSKNLRRCDNIVRYRLRRLEKLKAVSCEIINSIAHWNLSPNIHSGLTTLNLGPMHYKGRAIHVEDADVNYLILLE